MATGMETDSNLKNLGYTFHVVSARLSEWRDLFSLYELRLYLPFDVQREFCARLE